MKHTRAGTLFHGDSEDVLKGMDEDSVGLVFTSPPYYNARDYSTYANYADYLWKMQRVFAGCMRVLQPGRFLVVNSSPVLIPRESRSKASVRLPIPFDLHRVISELGSPGFDFVEDIVWVKPEGAGWASGRGRRFAADRHPLQYKCVPVTEYVFVYRKHCDKLIDWNIRSHADQAAVSESKITGEYDVTNVWEMTPASDRRHPAIFPVELATKVIRYYSFKGDKVLDPFGGLGTTGKAAKSMGRQFALIEQSKEYYDAACDDLVDCFNEETSGSIKPHDVYS